MIIRCSGLARPMQCPGFLFFKDLPPQPSNPAADLGTAAGELLDLMFDRHLQPPTHAKNGVRFDEDMKFHLIPIRDVIESLAVDGVLREQRIDWVTRSGIIIKGQYDMAYVDRGGVLNIDDLKYGYGIIEPEMNWQLIAYAIGEVIRRGKVFETIKLTIHQPRAHHENGPTRTWAISYSDLLALKENIEAQCDAIAAGVNTLVTGKSCKYCPAAAVCPAANRAFYNSLEVALAHTVDDISNGDIARELDLVGRAMEFIRLRKDSLEALAVSRITGGAIVPGYLNEANYGDRKWKANISPEAIELMTGTKITKTEMLSPAQAEKAGVPKNLVKDLVERRFIGQKLVKKDSTELGNKIFGKPKGA